MKNVIQFFVIAALAASNWVHAAEIICDTGGNNSRTLTVHDKDGEKPVMEGFADFPLSGKVKVDADTHKKTYQFSWAYSRCGGAQNGRESDSGVLSKVEDFIYNSGDCDDRRTAPTLTVTPNDAWASLTTQSQTRSHGSYLGIAIPGFWGNTHSHTETVKCEFRAK